MKKQSFWLVLLFLICISIPLRATVQIVDIPDPNLRAAIENELGKAPGATITVADMETLTELLAPNASITDVTGLEAATNLTLLHLGAEIIVDNFINSNSISDISPLAGLTNLTHLGLSNNSISGISALAELTQLTDLWINNNTISDITALAGLTNLTELMLQNNSISDLSPLVANTGLGSAAFVDVQENPLDSLSINTHIPALQSRGIIVEFDNDIVRPVDFIQAVDIPDPNLRAVIESELRKPQGTTITVATMLTLTKLYARNDDISDLTGLEHATNVTRLVLSGNRISDISPLAGLTQLAKLDLMDNSISDISPLAGLTQLYELNLQNNSISDLSPLVANIGLGIDDSIDVRGNFLNATSINTHIPILEGREVRVSFHDIVVRTEDITQIVDIPDPNLRVQIAYARGKMPSAPITVADMVVLVHLSASEAGIRDLTGLEHAINLTTLWLELNSISDLSPLAGLTNLRHLNLRSNDVFDLSPLVANTGLGAGDYVNVRGNPLNVQSIITHLPALQSRGVSVKFTNIVVRPEDIAKIVDIPDSNFRAAIEEKLGKSSGDPITVADMTTLVYLYIDTHDLSDLTGLAHATNLRKLSLWGNRISDISPLAGLTDLWALQLYSNSITDISPLARLTNLTELWLSNNSISDISPIAGLTDLELLFLSNNSISDISPIAGLNELGQLRLANNSISDISPLAGLTQLNWLRLEGNNITDVAPLVGLNELRELQIDNNSISDLSPLVENTGLRNGDRVFVTGNPLSALSINTHIPALQSRGVIVEFDDIVAQPADVNADGIVNILDLVSVAAQLGKQGQNLAADVNGDGVVGIFDLVLVAGMFDAAAAAPSAQPQATEKLTAAAVRGWLTEAQALQIHDPIMGRGIMVLQQLLMVLTPTETELLANYPNPFNPETWIPYRLAKDAFVTLTIYDGAGQIVRTIDLGHQTAAAYESRSQAIYWDGRNQIGEKVASGVYFYHLSAGDYSATRKMLILK